MKAKTNGTLLSAALISLSGFVLAQSQPPRPPGPGAQPPSSGQQRPAAQQQGRRPAQRTQTQQTTQANLGNPLQPRFGDPLPGITTAERAAFVDGRNEFLNRENAAGGLGPIFNRDSCVSCHGGPAPGGGSPINVTRFGTLTNGVFDPLTSLGGSLLQERSITPQSREVVPPQALIRARRNSTPLFGLGLIEAIPDVTILAGVRTTPVDGVKGKVSMVVDVTSGQARVGKFGWKAQQATLLAFSGDAYVNEMGVTNRFFPTENAPNGDAARLAAADQVADPEDTIDPANGKADIDRSADFMRLLAPPPPLALTASAAQGRNIFNQVNCHLCHTPTMMSGDSPIAALRNKAVNLYSDLLLHDMGTLGDRIVQGDASGTEMKTAPLWGLRASAPYLHDGRAPNVDAAIRAHDGEAKAPRDRYNALTPAQKQQLLDFLNSI